MSIPLCVSDSSEAILFLWEEIKRRVPIAAQDYAETLEPALVDAVAAILDDKEVQARLDDVYFMSLPEDENRRVRFERRENASVSRKERDSLNLDISELIYLYKETYADLSMLSLLPLSPESYVEMIEKDINREGAEVSPQAVERIAAVIYSLYGRKQRLQSGSGSALLTLVNTYLNWIDSRPKDVFGSKYHNFEAIGALVQYLGHCHKKIKNYDENNREDYTKVRAQFVSFAENHEFASMEFYQALEEHRESLLSRVVI